MDESDVGPALPGVDLDHANAARMYDYFLGGANNFAVDRELGDRVERSMPTIRAWASGNRRFLRRLVRFCLDAGVHQFLDLGSGIPATGHVHEIAREVEPSARVAYVDVEPVAAALSRDLLAGVEGTSITQADVRDPDAVLTSPSVTAVLDFSQPIAVLAVALLHFVPDHDRPAQMLAAYRDALVPGSVLAITHGSLDYDDPVLVEQLRAASTVYESSATPGTLRSRRRIRDLVSPLTLVEPGLVDLNRWRGDPDAPELGGYAAVAIIDDGRAEPPAP